MTRVSERASSISRSDNSVISHTTDSKEDARRVRRTGLGRYLRHSFPALSLHVDCRRWSRVADWSARRKGDSPVGRGRASQSRHTIRPEAAQCPLADRVCPSGLTEFAPGLTERAGCTRGPPSPLQLVNSRSRDYYKAAADVGNDYYKAAADVGNADATVVDTGCNMLTDATAACNSNTQLPHTHRQH